MQGLDEKLSKESIQKIIEPYSHIAYIISRIERLIDKNQVLLCKRVINRELDNLKGYTEQKCKKRKLKQDYCKFCDNYYCNLNLNKKN